MSNNHCISTTIQAQARHQAAPHRLVTRLRLLVIIGILTACGLRSHAQTAADSTVSPHITTSAYMIGFGPSRLLDTYLSSAHFRGTGFTFLATRERSREQSRWSTLLEHQAQLSTAHDQADKANELEGAYSFFIGRFYRWSLWSDRLQLQAGAMGQAHVGFVYNTVNGNNPAQARLNISLMPSATANYRFRLFDRLMAVRYELQLPLAGIMFSPNYGQSYYELFSRGDYDHNVVPTTMVCAPDFRQQLSLDVNLSRRLTLRIGYLGDYRQASVNRLKTHTYSHRLMIGIVKRFKIISYRP